MVLSKAWSRYRSRRIGKHRGFEIVRGEIVTNGEAEYVDHLVCMRPDQMRTENVPAILLDERLVTVHGFADAPGGEPVHLSLQVPPNVRVISISASPRHFKAFAPVRAVAVIVLVSPIGATLTDLTLSFMCWMAAFTGYPNDARHFID
jgi:hypothetical protein